MTVLSITRDTNQPNIVRVLTDNTQSEITANNYLTIQTPIINELNSGEWVWNISDIAHISGTETPILCSVNVPVNSTFSLLVLGSDLPVTDTKGQLITYSTGPNLLDVGTNGQVLTANSAALNGIDWETPASDFLPDTKGQLITYGASPALLNVGTDGQVLTANSGAPNGIDWETLPGSLSPEDVQDQTFVLVSTSGTNTLTGTANPTLTAYNDGMMLCCFGGESDGTANVTIDIDGVGAVPILTNAFGTDLQVQLNDIIPTFGAYIQYSTANGCFYLLNPQGAGGVNYLAATNSFTYGEDIGAVNAYIIRPASNLNFPSGTVPLGYSIFFEPDSSNTGISTLQIRMADGTNTTAVQVVLMANASLRGGELVSGRMYQVVWSGANWWLLNPSIPLPQRRFAGDPNTNLSGNLGQLCIDTSNNFLYYCSTAGNAASAVWTKIVV